MRAGAECPLLAPLDCCIWSGEGGDIHSNPPVTAIVPPARSPSACGSWTLGGRTQSVSRRVLARCDLAWRSRPAGSTKTWWVGGWPREWPRGEPGPAGRVQDSGAAQCRFELLASLSGPDSPRTSHGGTHRAPFLLVGWGPDPTFSIQGSGSAAVWPWSPGPRSNQSRAGLRWCCSLASGHSRTGTRAMGVVLGWDPGNLESVDLRHLSSRTLAERFQSCRGTLPRSSGKSSDSIDHLGWAELSPLLC